MEDLYRQRLPEGEEIPILVQMLIIADIPPEGEAIAVAVWRLRTGQTGELSGMMAEHLKPWLREATK